MAWNLNNYARVNRRAPSAWAICDFCGRQDNRVNLYPDRQYMGTEIRPTGFLVCLHCLDRPQPQQKAILLPPDPLPVENPRVDNFPNGNQGFTQYLLSVVQPPLAGGIGQMIIGVTPIGGLTASTNYTGQTYPTDDEGVLASLAAISGIPTPTASPPLVPLNYWDTAIATPNVAQTVMPANPNRYWVALYNPGGTQLAFSLGTAAFGNLFNLMTGPGECWFWAAPQNAGAVPTGPITVIGLNRGAPVWAWDAGQALTNDGGFVGLTTPGFWPLSPVGLAPGSLWCNGLLASVVGPTSPNPYAAALSFSALNPTTLLQAGGADLPLADPHATGDLWNNGGFVCISAG